MGVGIFVPLRLGIKLTLLLVTSVGFGGVVGGLADFWFWGCGGCCRCGWFCDTRRHPVLCRQTDEVDGLRLLLEQTVCSQLSVDNNSSSIEIFCSGDSTWPASILTSLLFDSVVDEQLVTSARPASLGVGLLPQRIRMLSSSSSESNSKCSAGSGSGRAVVGDFSVRMLPELMSTSL